MPYVREEGDPPRLTQWTRRRLKAAVVKPMLSLENGRASDSAIRIWLRELRVYLAFVDEPLLLQTLHQYIAREARQTHWWTRAHRFCAWKRRTSGILTFEDLAWAVAQ